jgi:hypothetical protein
VGNYHLTIEAFGVSGLSPQPGSSAELANRLVFSSLKSDPPHPIILHPITPHPRRLVGDRPLHRPSRQRVIHDGSRDHAVGHGLDVLPANLPVSPSAFAFAREADAAEPLAVGEDDAAIHVVSGVALVLLHHRELHAVDGDQFIECEAEGRSHQQPALSVKTIAHSLNG